MSFLILLFSSAGLAFASTEPNSEVLEKIWTVGKQSSCSPEMRARFDDATLSELKSRAGEGSNRSVLSTIVNPFLFSLGYSHTQLFTPEMESYYLFKGYYASIEPAAPAAPLLVNPGVQVGTDDRGYFVREVLHGFAASDRGLIKGDRILTVDGKPFIGNWGSVEKADAVVQLSRQGRLLEIRLPLRAVNWSQAFQDATLNSIQVISYRARRFGYVRLWSGVHPDSAEALWTAVKKFKAEGVDGVVLDLRGGYGGAFWWHLDPFFSDRRDYFVMSATDGEGQTSVLRAPPQSNSDAYLGPMAVLINEGSRSGKEALAYQFKKSKRARVIGTATPGYFAAGGLFFLDQPVDYFLYLCVKRDSTLDGVAIEGIGVRPDVEVGFSVDNELRDSQLKAGLEYLVR